MKRFSTKDLTGKRVVYLKKDKNGEEKEKRVGKIRAFVFHPTERRVLGFIIKRPDAALMFHRRDFFVTIGDFRIVENVVVLDEDPASIDKRSYKKLDVSYDDCVLWEGMPILTLDGTNFGLVEGVSFDLDTGDIDALMATQGATANALLGTRQIPAHQIKGFRRGMGVALTDSLEEDELDPTCFGAILVSDEVKDSGPVGGVAEKAGKATAVVTHKVKTSAKEASEKAKPAVKKAAKTANEAVNAGAFATGRQLERSRGMFKAFKDELDKALKEDTNNAK